MNKLIRYATRLIPDSIYIRLQYFKHFGKLPNLRDPKTFDEKLLWLKLYDRNPLHTDMVDKFKVKQYVANLIGEKYVIPTIGKWDKPENIDFDSLPNQFVLKWNHDSGSVIICKDKSCLDRKKIINKLKKSDTNAYWNGREWPYKNVKRCIIAEKYLEDSVDQELRDYKFYSFNGKPYYLLLVTNRQSMDSETCFDYFNMDFKHLDLQNHWHPNAKVIPRKPDGFEEMKKLAAKLSENKAHVRIDFYEVNGKIYFGEMTFFDYGGLLELHPNTWELEWGNLIDTSLAYDNRKIHK